MTHLLRHNPTPCQPLARSPRSKKYRWFLLAALAGVVISLASCSEDYLPDEPPTVQITGMEPLGSGIKVLGYAVLGGCVVIVMGRILTR